MSLVKKISVFIGLQEESVALKDSVLTKKICRSSDFHRHVFKALCHLSFEKEIVAVSTTPYTINRLFKRFIFSCRRELFVPSHISILCVEQEVSHVFYINFDSVKFRIILVIF